MNSNLASGKWTEIKGELQKTWGKITGDEFEKTKGDMKAIAGLVEQRYGMSRDEASQKVSKLYGKFQETKENFKHSVAQGAEKVKENFKKSNERKH